MAAAGHLKVAVEVGQGHKYDNISYDFCTGSKDADFFANNHKYLGGVAVGS